MRTMTGQSHQTAWAAVMVALLAVCASMALGVSVSAAESVAPAFSSTSAGFGFQSFEVSMTQAPPPGSPPGTLGAPATQAGSHPYALTVTFELNKALNDGTLDPVGGEVKNLAVNAPPGLTGDPNAATQCTRQELDIEACPSGSQIGVDTVGIGDVGENLLVLEFPVYNMVPPPGVPAEFAFDIEHVHVFLEASVRTGSDYGITVHAENITQQAPIYNSTTLWGVPGDPSHDAQRCTAVNGYYLCGLQSDAPTTPFLTLPTSCEGSQAFSAQASTWEEPNQLAQASFLASGLGGSTLGFTGCERLHFDPLLNIQPETPVAGAPTGLNVDLRFSQEEAGGLVSANLRDATVSLPVGMTLSPSAAAGLGACTPEEIGLGNAGRPSCPASSQVATAEASTPILTHPLVGAVYLAQQDVNPFGSLIALYLVLEGSGVVIKLPGEVRLDSQTGQITTTFKNSPDQPVSDIKLSFFGGPRAPLVNPGACAGYTTTSQLTPWSAPASGPAREPSSSFEIDQGCQTLGFAPSFTAGTTDNQAGAFSPFSVTFSRNDGEQDLDGITVRTPQGLLGVLKGVERCPEPQASQGTCGPNSLIGHTTVAVGPGPDPVYVQGGQVFLTGPYKGAPFGLSVVVPAVAGPFNLGNVVVRAAVSIDPHTAQITVTSDPLPTILQGIPLQVRTVNVTIDRAGFMFNPTNCESLTVGGSLTSTHGATAAVSSPFEAANCANLPFHPVFTVSSQAKTSKKDGASLTVKTTYPAGTQANIRSVAVLLPKQLPARLTTIQQACPEATFNANPASCPAGSNIGIATASTPILASPVTGPAYLVSHGGAAFPDVVAILQGEGVTVDLVGSIDIKHGVTSSTFASIPDAPISSFQLALPEGPHSGLAAVLPAKAKGSLCGQSLSMPFTITAQNGAVLKQTPKITVTGCPRVKAKAKKKHGKGKGKKG
jgi:hypothetical protein